MKTNYLNPITTALGVTSFVVLGVMFLIGNQPVSGSVAQGQEYMGTTTSVGTIAAVSVLTSSTTPSYGSLGSVIITGAAAGTINIYDATTTDVNRRTGNKATSTLVLATLPNSTAAGTYTFDRVYTTGLLVEITGTVPTSTITWR